MSNHKILDDFDGSAIGENFLATLHGQVHGATDFSQLSTWLEQNTKHPLRPKEQWTFAEHEYQIDILNSTEHEEFYQKCSQVGASELFVRMKLAMMGISEALTIIYVLPTRTFALRFAKGRIDPVIDKSPALKALLNKEVNSSEMKQFGDCFLYITGSFGQSAAISIPAQVLFWDEVDFCNQKNLTTFRSRMGHSKEDDLWFVRGFSTPTVFDYGINLYFRKGSQAYYCVWSPGARDFVAIEFFRDLVIPGFDRPTSEWDKEFLTDPTVKIDRCFFRCPVSGQPIPWENFLDPAKRRWIHTFPDRKVKSRQISPFDVAHVNSPARTLRAVEEYEVKGDWVNFKVGVPHEDASSSFMVDKGVWTDGEQLTAPLSHAELDGLIRSLGLEQDLPGFMEWLQTQPVIANTCALGMDVGKTCWFTVNHVETANQRNVIYAERASYQVGNILYRFMYLFHTYGCLAGVTDAGPDVTLAQSIVRALPGVAYACEYETTKAGQLQRIQFKDREGIVSVKRTRTFDKLVSDFNTQRQTFAKIQEQEAFKLHLRAVKRISEMVDEGEKGDRERSKWISTDADHFAHSLLYSNVAADLVYSLDGFEAHERSTGSAVIGVLPNVGKFRQRH